MESPPTVAPVFPDSRVGHDAHAHLQHISYTYIQEPMAMDCELDGQVALEVPDVDHKPMLGRRRRDPCPNVRPIDVIPRRIAVAP